MRPSLPSEVLARLTPAQRQHLEARLAALPRRQDAAAPAAILPIERRSGLFAPSFAQQRLWLLSELDPEHPDNVAVGLAFEGELSTRRLWHAVAALPARHETLRTRFVRPDGELRQEIVASCRLDGGIIDLSGLPPSAAGERSRGLAAQRALTRFDLSRVPQLAAHLLRLDDQHHQLFVVCPHIAVDGWSVGLLLADVANSYAGREPQRLPVQFLDYALWERDELGEERRGQLLGFWRRALAEAPIGLDLPTDFPRPLVQELRGDSQPVRLPAELTQACRRLAQEHGATLFTVLWGAFALTLARWAGVEDLVIGSASANRLRPELRHLVGPLSNTLVLRARLAAAESFAALLPELHHTVLAAHAHQQLPAEEIITALEIERDPSRQPLFETVFLLQNFPSELAALPGLRLSVVDPPRQQTRFDLALLLAEDGDGLGGELRYSTGLFTADTIAALAASYQRVLAQLVAAPKAPLTALQLSPALVAQAQLRRARPVVVAATFTAEPLGEMLRFWSALLDLPLKVRFADYGQVFQELLTPDSLMASHHNGANVLLLRLEDWLRHHEEGGGEARAPEPLSATEVLSNIAAELAAAVRAFVSRSTAPLLVVTTPPSARALAAAHLAAGLEAAQTLLRRELAELPTLRFLPWTELLALYPVLTLEDEAADELGHIPYSEEFFAALGTLVARQLHALWTPPPKLVVVDCDNTLWRGVVGEDGAQGVEIGPARRLLQERLLALESAGTLLALASKNEPKDVEEVFSRRREMVLGQQHLVDAKISWQAKTNSLLELANELSLGLGDFVFLDDSPFECAAVRSLLPEVQALTLPDAEEEIAHFLAHLWSFDPRRTTEEDRNRTALYRRELEREKLRRGTADLESFLAGLELVVEVTALAAADLPRAAQLTQRTNQFNLTTLRRNEAELECFVTEGGEAWTVAARDRFGSYGLIGLVLWREQRQALVVDTFLLSCRVLGRGVEHQVLARLGERAGKRGLGRLELPFRATARNRPAAEFLSGLSGAERRQLGQDSLYLLTPALAAVARPRLAANVEAAQAPARDDRVQANTGRRLPAALAQRLAGELSRPREVLAAVRSWGQRHRGKNTYEAPLGPIEQTLAEIFAVVLKVDRVGRHDSFFSLGGQSLLGTFVLSRLERELGVSLPLLTLFEHPTPARLAEAVERALVAQLGAEQQAALAAELAGLSAQELDRLLAEEQALYRGMGNTA